MSEIDVLIIIKQKELIITKNINSPEQNKHSLFAVEVLFIKQKNKLYQIKVDKDLNEVQLNENSLVVIEVL